MLFHPVWHSLSCASESPSRYRWCNHLLSHFYSQGRGKGSRDRMQLSTKPVPKKILRMFPRRRPLPGVLLLHRETRLVGGRHARASPRASDLGGGVRAGHDHPTCSPCIVPVPPLPGPMLPHCCVHAPYIPIHHSHRNHSAELPQHPRARWDAHAQLTGGQEGQTRSQKAKARRRRNRAGDVSLGGRHRKGPGQGGQGRARQTRRRFGLLLPAALTYGGCTGQRAAGPAPATATKPGREARPQLAPLDRGDGAGLG